MISDEPTEVKTLEAYGLRFDIEENFLDDKSKGFQLESSLIRSPKALERLCFVLAMSTLYLVSQGTAVVQQGKRRFVDPHWFRSDSYCRCALSRSQRRCGTPSMSKSCTRTCPFGVTLRAIAPCPRRIACSSAGPASS